MSRLFNPESSTSPHRSGLLPKWLAWALLTALVLIVTLGPFLIFEVEFQAWLTTAFEQLQNHPWLLGTLIVALLAGDCVLPVPSSLVSIFAGATLGWAVGGAVIWLGMCCGCLTAYLLGVSGGRLFAMKILGDAELARAQTLFTHIGPATLVITRAVPVLAEAGAIAAGVLRMSLRSFLLATTLANALVAAAFAAAGAAGKSLLPAFFGVVALPIIGWLLWRFMLNRSSRTAK